MNKELLDKILERSDEFKKDFPEISESLKDGIDEIKAHNFII